MDLDARIDRLEDALASLAQAQARRGATLDALEETLARTWASVHAAKARVSRFGDTTHFLLADLALEVLPAYLAQHYAIHGLERHQACVDRLTELFSGQVAGQAVIRVQGPIRLGERSEPQPDLAVLRRRADFYAAGHPGPEDVLLVVEVAETSQDYDRAVKVPLYARAGVREVWLVDLAGEGIEIYRRPWREGYQEVRRLGRGDRVASEAVAALELAADDILGSA